MTKMTVNEIYAILTYDEDAEDAEYNPFADYEREVVEDCE